MLFCNKNRVPSGRFDHIIIRKESKSKSIVGRNGQSEIKQKKCKQHKMDKKMTLGYMACYPP